MFGLLKIFCDLQEYDERKYRHRYMESENYYNRVKRAFEQPMLTIKVPASLSNKPSSRGSGPSTARAPPPPPPAAANPVPDRTSEFVRNVTHLHSLHGLHPNEITLFSRYVEANRTASSIFYSLHDRNLASS